MKKIRIKICNFIKQDPFNLGHFLMNILKKYYDVELTENPDYIFYTESTPEYLNYDCIRIFFTGENVSPNFNFCDYAIGFDYLNFQDRYYRLPLYLITVFYSHAELNLAGDPDFSKQIPFTKDDLAKKREFCSFVYANYLSDGRRKEFFDTLSEYKEVNSGGPFLNNVGGKVPNKLAFELNHKFSIAFENSSRSGYTTEKLVNSLVARTIPIYWGNPDVYKEFNEKRFINCHSYKNFDEVVDKVKEIDNNDELYLKMINEPVKAELDYDKTKKDFELFLQHIFDQDIEKAKRRTINPMRARNLEDGERFIAKHNEKLLKRKKILAKLYSPFKKFPLFEKLKQKYFYNKYLKK